MFYKRHVLKILEYYYYFSLSEIKRLTLFLESAYFNNEAALVQLHHAIMEQVSAKKEMEEIDLAQIHKKLFPNKKFNESYLRVLMTKLIKLIEKFVETEYCSVPYHKKFEVLQRFKLKRNYESLIKKTISLEPENFKDDLFYLSKSLLYEDYNAYLSPSIGDHIEDYKHNIIEFNKNFDIYFITKKLKSLCNITNDQAILNTQYELTYKDELLKIIYSDQLDEIIPIRLYKLLYRLINKEDGVYDPFVDLVKENAQKLSIDEVFNFLAHAQNYCIKQINSSKFEFFEKMHDLYVYRIENNFVLSQNEINPRLFKNVVNTALRVGEADWTHDFIKTYSKFLPKSEYEKAYNFNMAFYQFEIKHYSKTIELLSKVEYDDLYYGFNVRMLLMKSYYELDEMEALDHLLQSFKVFISRKKGISEYYKLAHQNVIFIVKKLVDVNPRDKKKLIAIKLKFESLKPVAETAWLKEKIAEFGV